MKTVERKIVQVVPDEDHGVLAVADDGTAWMTYWSNGTQMEWTQIKPLPPREVSE